MTKEDDAAKRAAAEAEWEKAKADIARHDAEFERKHGGKK